VPFGVRSSLASQSLHKCATFSDHLVFILPIAFLGEKQIKQHVPENYHLQWFKRMRNTKFDTPRPSDPPKTLNVAFAYFKNLGRPRSDRRRISQTKHNPYFDVLVAPTLMKRKMADIRIRGTGYNAGQAFSRDDPKFFINKQRTDDWFVVLKHGGRQYRNTICQTLNQTKWRFHNLVPNVKYLDRKQLEKALKRMSSELFTSQK